MQKLLLFCSMLFVSCSNSGITAPFNIDGKIKKRVIEGVYLSVDSGDTIRTFREEVFFRKGGRVDSISRLDEFERVCYVAGFSAGKLTWKSYQRGDTLQKRLQESQYEFHKDKRLKQIRLIAAVGDNSDNVHYENFYYDMKKRIKRVRIDNVEENAKAYGEYRFIYGHSNRLRRVEVEQQKNENVTTSVTTHTSRIFTIDDHNLPLHETYIDHLDKDTLSKTVTADTSENYEIAYYGNFIFTRPGYEYLGYLQPFTMDSIRNTLMNPLSGSYINYNRVYRKVFTPLVTKDSIIDAKVDAHKNPVYTKLLIDAAQYGKGKTIREATISYDYF